MRPARARAVRATREFPPGQPPNWHDRPVKEQAGPTDDRAVAAEPAAAAVRGPADPVSVRLDRLRAGGNRATGRLLAQQRRLQRSVGWADEPAASPNRAEKDVSGVRRIPVDGLPVVRRALVLLSPGIRLDAQVHVLVHLHGENAGYLGTAPRDLAAGKDRIEEQLVAAGRPQLVLVLPQGGPGRQLRRGREPRPARVRAGGARADRQAAAAARRRPALGALGRRLRDQDDPRRPGPAAHALRRGLVRRRPGEVARERRPARSSAPRR